MKKVLSIFLILFFIGCSDENVKNDENSIKRDKEIQEQLRMQKYEEQQKRRDEQYQRILEYRKNQNKIEKPKSNSNKVLRDQ